LSSLSLAGAHPIPRHRQPQPSRALRAPTATSRPPIAVPSSRHRTSYSRRRSSSGLPSSLHVVLNAKQWPCHPLSASRGPGSPGARSTGARRSRVPVRGGTSVGRGCMRTPDRPC